MGEVVKWERFSDDDPYMNLNRMVNATVTLAYIHSDERVTGKVTRVREAAMTAFIALDNGREYELYGPMMWKIVEFTPGGPEVGDTVKLRRKMTTVIGPVIRIDRLIDGVQVHIPDYPAPLVIGDRHASWTVLSITKDGS